MITNFAGRAVFLISMTLLGCLLVYTHSSALSSRYGEQQGEEMTLPESIGPWRLTEPPRRIEPGTIFDYMNGGGELYLGYRFRYLEVFDYRDSEDTQLLAEIYYMESSDDAFGLLSLDWGGEPIELSGQGRGRYGAGLLRIWSGDIYARVLAERETPESRRAVLELGKRVAAGRTSPSPPKLLKALPPRVGDYRLTQQPSYFRSYLVLNSIYFLSSENILNLDLQCEAVTALYRSESGTGGSVRVLEIRYASTPAAKAALLSFVRAYLPEQGELSGSAVQPQLSKVEDGWMGCRLEGNILVLAFQCPSEAIAESFLNTALDSVKTWEKSDE